MIYKDFQGKKLSALGLGCMRFPLIDGKESQIDEEKTAEMVAYAMEKGVNYFDTAWGYHGGMSEIVMGKILNNYPRDSFYIATKFPGYDTNNMTRVQEIFEKQLEKTGMEYFDFYLFHNVCETNIDDYLDNEKYGLFTYLMEQKKNGRIKHLGFSVHGTIETTRRFLDAYGDHMEFCQVQLNWLDWDFQDAKAKVELLNELNIPIWVMEPLRGGKLATLPEKHIDNLKNLRPEETVPGWAFRYLQAIDGVTVTLSGMSNFTQLKENIETFENEKPLNDNEIATLYDIAAEMTKGIPCTACRYCVTNCPMELDIPTLLNLYNEHRYSGNCFLVSMRLETMPEEKHPHNCIGCQSCEAVCPQNIKISEALADFSERLKN